MLEGKTYLESLEHVISINLYTTHVELHGSNVIIDALFRFRQFCSPRRRQVAVGDTLLGNLALEGLEDLELLLQEDLSVLAVDAYSLAVVHGAFHDGYAAAVGIVAPFFVLYDGAERVMSRCRWLSAVVLVAVVADIVLEARLCLGYTWVGSRWELDIFFPASGDDLRVKGAAENANLAPRVPIWSDHDLVAVDNVVLKGLALQ